MNKPHAHSRRYSAFISYRHADNTQEGRRWAEWLHRALERYTVPPDLIGKPNLRSEPTRDSLYPIFRDEDELPANADLATGIRAALEVSDHLIVLCSPRSAVSPWVRKEVREFKELGRSNRILAIIIAGEPNADDPEKIRHGIMRDEECFCEELRFGAVRKDGTLDWTARTEPTAADLRPIGTRAEGFVTAEAYREYLTLNSSLVPDKIAARTDAYRQQLDHALIKTIAGLLGVALGQLKDRDAEHRAIEAEKEASKQRKIAERERELNEQARQNAEEAKFARLAAERTTRRLVLVGFATLVIGSVAVATGFYGWFQGKIAAKLFEQNQFEAGRATMAQARTAELNADKMLAIMLAGRALGFQGYGRKETESVDFTDAYPLLLANPNSDTQAETDRLEEVNQAVTFIASVRPTCLPTWASCMEDSVKSVAFSPDGTRLAGGSDDTTIKLWDITTGKELATLCGHKDKVWCVIFSSDGRYLASGSEDATIKLWHVDSGKEIASLQGHNDLVTSVAFSPDSSRLISGSSDKSIKLWDLAAGKILASLHGHTDSVTSVVFKPDGDHFASASYDKTVKLWDAKTFTEIADLHGHDNWVTSVAFSPDGSRLASSGNITKIWDWISRQELLSVQAHEGSEWSTVKFSPDGKHIASASYDKAIKIWEPNTRKLFARFGGHLDTIMCLAYSHDGNMIASGSVDKTIKLWDVSVGGDNSWLPEGTRSLVVNPDGSCIAGISWGGAVKIWDAPTGTELANLQADPTLVNSVAFAPDGTLLAGGSGGIAIKLWDTMTGKEIADLTKGMWSIQQVSSESNGSKIFMALGYYKWKPGNYEEVARRYKNDSTRILLIDRVTGKVVPDEILRTVAQADPWLIQQFRLHSDRQTIRKPLDLTAPLRSGMLAFRNREIVTPEISQTKKVIHYRHDTLAQLADPKLTPARRAELRMELCTKSSQFRAATALWQRLLRGEWPGFEGATVPRKQAPATIPADSPIRRLYLLALIDAAKHPQIHGHPTICQTAAQIAPVLTKEMMATPTISLAIMSLMQTLANDDSPDMSAPRAALMTKLEEVATKEWLAVLRESNPELLPVPKLIIGWREEGSVSAPSRRQL